MFQDTEIYKFNNHQYLLIHKNACSQITHTLTENYGYLPMSEREQRNDILLWTTSRDPFERFISGFCYDIERQLKNYVDINDLDYIFSKYFNKELFYELVFTRQPPTGSTGNVNHCCLQTTFMLSHGVDVIVPIQQINDFLSMHFPKFTITENSRNKQDGEFKKRVLEYIKNKPELKDLIDAYLSADYYYLNQLYKTCMVWTWNKGRLFEFSI